MRGERLVLGALSLLLSLVVVHSACAVACVAEFCRHNGFLHFCKELLVMPWCLGTKDRAMQG
jgi:hypothetical protein